MIKIKFKTIDSTHKYALELINKGKAMECVIVADKQTNGIGRGDHSWFSVTGNLCASILLKISQYGFNNFGHLSLLIACSVRDTISVYLKDQSLLTLHWPNDVYYNSKKISGILLAKLDGWVIISVGININSIPHVKTAISMSELENLGLINGNVPSSCLLLDCLLSKLKYWINLFQNRGFLHVKKYWLQHAKEVGETVTIKNGNEFLTGVFYDIDDFGRLVLKNGGEYLYVSTGDMFLNPEGDIKTI